MSSKSWMPLYVPDYLADTAHLDCAESGAYLHLIMHYWQHGSLPNDDRRLASIARAMPEQWASMKPTIARFFTDGWRHRRVDAELQKSRDAYARRAAAGKLGGEAKANNVAMNVAMLESESSNAVAYACARQPQPLNNSESKDSSLLGAHKRAPQKRGTRLASDWEPSQKVGDWAERELGTEKAQLEFDKFCDYWESKPGSDAVKLDWDKTFKNWVRTAKERKPNGAF